MNSIFVEPRPSVNIIYTDDEDVRELCGGAALFAIKEEDITDEVRKAFPGVKGGITITIHNDLRKIATPREIDALIAHEQGHYVHADYEVIMKYGDILNVPDDVRLQLELRADEYAAHHVGAIVMINALEKAMSLLNYDRMFGTDQGLRDATNHYKQIRIRALEELVLEAA